jgi:hypothetical protein
MGETGPSAGISRPDTGRTMAHFSLMDSCVRGEQRRAASEYRRGRISHGGEQRWGAA